VSNSRPHGHSPAWTYSRMNYGLLPQDRTDARRAISGNCVTEKQTPAPQTADLIV